MSKRFEQRNRQPINRRILSAMLLFAAFCGANTADLNAAGTPGASAEKVPEGQTAADTSAAHYQAGLVHKQSALAKEAEAASVADPSLQSWLLLESREEFQVAANYFGRALKLDLNHYEAANELGYALRKSGDYRKAIGAYNFALVIKPDFYEAIEYRGEAYFALGMLDRARDAYMVLFRNDLQLAAQLLQVMGASGAGARDSDQPLSADFAAWVRERQAIAEVTPGASAAPDRDW